MNSLGNGFHESYDKTKGLNMKELVTEYIESLKPDYEEALLATGKLLGVHGQRIILCRLPLPASVPDALFVYKSLGSNPVLVHCRRNEAYCTQIAASWGAGGYYEHARVPELYCGFYEITPGEVPKQPIFICLEYIPGITYIQAFGTEGCRGWSFREKRQFVRQMALFRLSMMSIRGDLIGGSDPATYNGYGPLVGDAVVERDVFTLDHPEAVPLEYYSTLDPQPSEEAWTKQSIQREIDFWQDTLTAESFIDFLEDYGGSEYDWDQDSWVKYLLDIHIDPQFERRYRKKEEQVELDDPFCFHHGDMHRGYNVQMETFGKKIVAVIDWEKAMTVPYSFAIRDLFDITLGIGDPDELIGEDIPFQLDMYWDHTIHLLGRLREWNRKTRARREKRALGIGHNISHMNDNNFAAYGELTQQDLLYGDCLSEEADTIEPQDSIDPFYFYGNRPFLIEVETAVLEPGKWYYEPVLHLIDQYLQKYGKISKLCKWVDPYVALWARDPALVIHPF